MRIRAHMNKSMKTMSGVTLLEIMLVLAIASMVIVLSIKYYKSANASSQANAMMSTLQAITASAENLSQGTGSYLNVTTASVTAAMGMSTIMTPWNNAIASIAGTTTSFTASFTLVPDAVCALLLSKVKANPSTAATSCASGSLTYVYTTGVN